MVFENVILEQCEDSKSIGNLTIAINLVTACIEAHLLRSSRQEKGFENLSVFAAVFPRVSDSTQNFGQTSQNVMIRTIA